MQPGSETPSPLLPLLPAKRSTAAVATRLLCWLAISLALIRMPGAMPSERIDPSWLAFLGHAFQERLQAGVDYVFTYGPLGAFYGNVFLPELHWPRYAWELCVRPLQAFTIVFLLGRLLSTRALVVATAFLCWFFLLHIDAQSVWHLSILTSLLILEGSLGIGLGVVVSVTAFLAIASLVKFSFLYQAVIGLAVILAVGRDPDPRRRLSGVVGYGLCFAIGWIACGQRGGSLLPYLTSSLEVARAYSDAMAIPGSATLLALTLVALALSVALIVATSASRGRAERRTGEALLLLASCFLAFKHGVVRQDVHLSSTFALLLVTPLLLRPLLVSTPRSRMLAALRVLVFLVSALGFALTNAEYRGIDRLFALKPSARWRAITAPAAEGERLLGLWRTQEQRFALPETRKRIGDRRVDVFTSAQGVLILNRFRLASRPVFQSHMAFTPGLLQANAEFYRSQAAPEFVLLSLRTVDGRFPTLEDSVALRVVRDRYALVAREGPYLVLQRTAHAQPGAAATLPDAGASSERGRVAFDAWVACDPALLERDWGLTLSIRPSLLGRLRSFLFRGARVFLELDVGGTTPVRYRLIPEMAEAPFLVSPSPVGIAATGLLLPDRGRIAPRLRRFRVVAEGAGLWFEPEIGYAIVGGSELRPLTIAAGAEGL